jgi:uncharacterized membrane protein
MESRVKLFGHPIHPQLIVFPLGLLATAVIFDVLYLIARNPAFPTVSFYMIAAGIVGGLLAAIFGLIDWMALPNNTRAKSIGGWHGIGNVVIVVLFAISWLLRQDNANFAPDSLALILSFAGVGLALITGWIGGELVYRLGVAVDPGANVNAPSSLSEKTIVASTSNVKRTTHR